VDSTRKNDCIDQILKSINDNITENQYVKTLFAKLLQSDIKDIHKDVIIDDIFFELMQMKEHVIFIIENFNYKTQFISDNDYYRLTRLCNKKYPNKLSFVLIVDANQSFLLESTFFQLFLSTFEVSNIPCLAKIPSNKIRYKPSNNIKMKTSEIYISYAWSDESEEILKILCNALDENKINYYVDKKDIEYRGNIREFEERLGKGDFIILIVSDKFLKSKDCMYEVLQITEKGRDISQIIFPIVLSDAKIYDPEQRIDYIKHWEDKKDSLNEKLKTIGAENLSGLHREINNYSKYRDIIDSIMTILKEMNNLSPDIHRDSKFNQLIDSLKDQQASNDKKDTKQKESQNINSRSINQYGTKSVYIEKNEGDVNIE